ncbi:hypothetical protein TNCV_4747191 [Trichonephila clavipes]|nr:hypothetical protein TNCV_4747191 [Trichonephila clavipes]
MHARHRRDMDWQTCSKIPGVSQIVAAAMDIHTTRSISELAGFGVRITIHIHRRLSMSEIRKPHVPTLRAHVQHHLSLSAHAFLCNYGSSG